jgi:hypothetical protein
MDVGASPEDVAALERVIKTFRGRGYTFSTVSQVIAP